MQHLYAAARDELHENNHKFQLEDGDDCHSDGCGLPVQTHIRAGQFDVPPNNLNAGKTVLKDNDNNSA